MPRGAIPTPGRFILEREADGDPVPPPPKSAPATRPSTGHGCGTCIMAPSPRSARLRASAVSVLSAVVMGGVVAVRDRLCPLDQLSHALQRPGKNIECESRRSRITARPRPPPATARDEMGSDAHISSPRRGCVVVPLGGSFVCRSLSSRRDVTTTESATPVRSGRWLGGPSNAGARGNR